MKDEPEQPTADQCEGRALIEESETAVRFATWHPQWGGYVGKCVVHFRKTTNDPDRPGCFEVWNWHDGEFPSDSAERKHYCAPEQLIRFGVEILEKMAQYQRTAEGGPVVPCLGDLIERLQRLSREEEQG